MKSPYKESKKEKEMKSEFKKAVIVALAMCAACAGEAGAGGALVGRTVGKVVAKEVAEQGAKVAVKRGMSSALERAAKTVATSALRPKTVMAGGVATGTTLVGVGAKNGLETEAEADRLKSEAEARAISTRMETAREIAVANPDVAAEVLSATAPSEEKSLWGRILAMLDAVLTVAVFALCAIGGLYLLGIGRRAWNYFKASMPSRQSGPCGAAFPRHASEAIEVVDL